MTPWLLALTLACAEAPAPTPQEAVMTPLTVSSPAFEPGQPIPTRFTCEGGDTSPALVWSAAPAGTHSIALVVDDPDAPVGTWTHWLLWDLPATATGLAEASKDGTSGTNDFGRRGYGGPCPPRGHGPHRYFFKVYALDTALDLPTTAKAKQVARALEGHVLAQGQVVGTYARE